MSNPNAPHQCVILIKLDLHELQHDGSCHGGPVEAESFVLDVFGRNKEECKENMENFIKSVKQLLN